MNPETVTSISANQAGTPTTRSANENEKEGCPFWRLFENAKSNTSGSNESNGNKAMSPGDGQNQGPIARLSEALHQLGLPLNGLRFPPDALPHLRSLLVAHGMDVENVEHLLNHCTNEDGVIEVDKLVVSLLGANHFQESAKEHMVVRAEQRPELETLLRELQLAPDEIRRLVEGSITSGGDLDARGLAEGLKGVDPQLTLERFLKICRKRQIDVQPQELKLNTDQSEYSERLELASRLRHEGMRPEQVKLLLERLASNSQQVQEMHPEIGEQNLKTDQDIQALLSKLQSRTSRDQVKNGHWARQGKTIPESLKKVISQPADGLAGQEPAGAEATQVASSVLEAQLKIEEEMAAELRAKQIQRAFQTDRVSKVAREKGAVTGAVASLTTEGTAGARVQALSPFMLGTSQSSNPAMEPQFRVAQQLIIMTANGESRTRLNLHPPELGRLQIEISVESNKLSATLVTETQVVKELMESHLGQLRQHLSQHDLHLENFQVSVGTDGSSYKDSNHEFLSNDKHNRQGEVADPTAVDVAQQIRDAEQRRVLDGGGRIDLFA